MRGAERERGIEEVDDAAWSGSGERQKHARVLYVYIYARTHLLPFVRPRPRVYLYASRFLLLLSLVSLFN